MSRSFDFLAADDSPAGNSNDWRVQAAFRRRTAETPERLTELRTGFLRDCAVEDANDRGQGRGRLLPAIAAPDLLKLVDGARRPAAEVLRALPRYSARLLLTFRLRTPLLTRDDDPFHLFDNPVRKDHLLGVPYLAAASLKGLAADAYQRAFPPAKPWVALGDDNHARTHAFRLADPAALRLFGLADDGAEREGCDGNSRSGRVHFSPIWFAQVEYLVMNPGKPEKAIGTLPIQFEAVARGQVGTLELVYASPHGTRDDDEATVRADLARLLAALGHWWPALGLGAKRLTGYGAIEIQSVELQSVGWEKLPGLKVLAGPPAESSPITTPTAIIETEPPNYMLFVADGVLLDTDEGAAHQRIDRLVRAEIADAEQTLAATGGLDKAKVKKRLNGLRNNQESRRAELKKHYARAVAYFAKHGASAHAPKPTMPTAEAAASVFAAAPTYALAALKLNGPGSWLDLAGRLADIPPPEAADDARH